MKQGSFDFRLAALIVAVAALGIAVTVLLMQGWGLKEQCTSLQACIQYSNVYGYYEATFYDSYSSPGGTATTKRTYTVNNDRLEQCTGCEVIYTSGYGNTTDGCAGGMDCSSILKQTDIIALISGMNISREFGLGSRHCFIGRTAAPEPFDAAVCFDESNRVVNYEEQGKRPFYRFNIVGYETGSLLS